MTPAVLLIQTAGQAFDRGLSEGLALPIAAKLALALVIFSIGGLGLGLVLRWAAGQLGRAWRNEGRR